MGMEMSFCIKVWNNRVENTMIGVQSNHNFIWNLDVCVYQMIGDVSLQTETIFDFLQRYSRQISYLD